MTKRIIAVALAALMLAVILPANAAIQATSVEVRGAVFDNGTNVPNATGIGLMSWDANNFAGFWYNLKDGLKSENLTIVSMTSDFRTINKNGLYYNTTKQPVMYKVSEKKGLFVENGLDGKLNKNLQSGSDGSATVIGGQNFSELGWQAEQFVALNGKANKLSKLILEQESVDKKTLTIGDTWDLGDGYTLSAQSIDAKATPRQAWIVLSKDGNKLDDKIIVQGQVYAYSATLGGESDVPIFVTYVDSVFAGATSDLLQLRYTWLISTSVTEIKSGDKYGNMKVTEDGSSTGTIVVWNEDSSIGLSKDSTNDIMGEMKFKVADSDTPRFYPMVEYQIGGEVTPTGTTTGTPSGTATVTVMGNQTTTLTATPTQPPTQTATATPAAAKTTQKTPGFEAVFAITGLLAVAFLVLRQRK